MPIKIPIQLDNGRFVETTDEEESINEFLKLLTTSPQGCFLADSNFGFSLINHRFEAIDKGENKFLSIYTKPADKDKGITTDNSNNNNTFSRDMTEIIEKYEPRLKDVSVKNPTLGSENGMMKTVFTIECTLNGEPFSQTIDTYFW